MLSKSTETVAGTVSLGPDLGPAVTLSFPAGDAEARGLPAPQAQEAGEAQSRSDARAMQSALAEGLQQGHVAAEAPLASGKREATGTRRGAKQKLLRAMKITIGLGLAVALGWSPLRALIATTSVEALVNARVETIRSPIDGVVEWAPRTGEWRADETPVPLRVRDPLADPTRLDDLRRQYAALEAKSGALARQSELASATLETLKSESEVFRQRRMKLLDARVKARAAELEAAVAKSTEAEASKRRIDQLRRSGAVSEAEADQIDFEWLAATAVKSAAEQRLEEAKAESDAIREGAFIGDSYNEGSSVEERAAALRLRRAELEAEAAQAQAQMKVLAAQIAEEEERYRKRSDAIVPLPASGRVWETLAAPGERVSKGQDIIRVLDCSQPVVSAAVDETVYDRLQIGAAATFRPLQGGGKSYRGEIVNLTGAAAASGNFAIPLAAMRKSTFYVTLAIEGLGGEGCSIGQTGTVTFDAGRAAPGSAWLGGDRLRDAMLGAASAPRRDGARLLRSAFN